MRVFSRGWKGFREHRDWHFVRDGCASWFGFSFGLVWFGFMRGISVRIKALGYLACFRGYICVY